MIWVLGEEDFVEDLQSVRVHSFCLGETRSAESVDVSLFRDDWERLVCMLEFLY